MRRFGDASTGHDTVGGNAFTKVVAIALCILAMTLSGCTQPVAAPGPCDRDRLYEVRIGSRWGYIDETGELVVSARYAEAFPFRDGYATARRPFGGWVVLDACGTTWPSEGTVLGGRIDGASGRAVGGFGDGLCAAREPGFWGERRYGYIGTDGNWAIAPQFTRAGPFSEGLAAVQRERGEGYGYIDTTGAWVIPPRFQDAHPFSEGRAIVRYRDQYAICERDGAVRSVNDNVLGIWQFSEGLCSAVKFGGESRLGFIGPGGDWAIPPQFERVWSPGHGFTEGLAVVEDAASGLCGYIDKTGAWVIPPRFQFARPFYGGLAAAREPGGDWGYIDPSGTWAIAPQFGSALDFQGALAMVDVTWDVLGVHATPGAYIDRTGKVVWERDST